MDEVLDKRRFYINGVWVEPPIGRDLDVIDPSTEEAIAAISLGTQSDTDRAVAAAAAAYPAWSTTPTASRLTYVQKICEIYERRKGEVAHAITSEMGAPRDMSLAEQTEVGNFHMRTFIETFEKFEFVRPLGTEPSATVIAWEPVGVVGLITPWNWPMNQVMLKAIPALLTGNTTVLKPSEIAPLSSMLFAEMVHEAGVPPGVFNLVNGSGEGVGTQLSTHPDVGMISFTGSTRAGIAVARAAAATLKKVSLELGGKGANLIFADADEDAVARGVRQCFANSGQSCSAPTRMLVQRDVYKRALETAAEIAESTDVASAHLQGDHIGPVASKQQWNKVQRLIESGLQQGARLIAGGPGLPKHLDRGYFVRPTVFADVSNDMTIAREEIFGPVLSIIPFESENDAVEIANDTAYGLSNYVQSGDPQRCDRVARRLRSGMVQMNGEPLARGSAYGGVGASGRAREGGEMGLQEFMDCKFISGWSAVGRAS